MNADALVVSVRHLVEFFDADQNARQHSNAIKTLAAEELGLALLVHYFKGRGDEAELLPEKCNTGGSKGKRLDGWIRRRPKGQTVEICYQVEVKAWSIHGFGGNTTPIPYDASEIELTAQRKAMWHQHYWDKDNQHFKAESLNKVLQAMKAVVEGATQLPIACLWDLMHPEGAADSFFRVPRDVDPWPSELWVFSMSSYLRSLPKGSQLLLPLPNVAARMQHLNRIFPESEGSSEHRA